MAERQISKAEASFVAGRLDEVAEICGDLIAADQYLQDVATDCN